LSVVSALQKVSCLLLVLIINPMMLVDCATDNPVCGSVLGIDPTFNFGDFFVTPTVYEHKMLKNKVTGKHPFSLALHCFIKTENMAHITILLLK